MSPFWYGYVSILVIYDNLLEWVTNLLREILSFAFHVFDLSLFWIIVADCLYPFQEDIDTEQEIKEAYKRYTDLKREKSQKVKKSV